MHSRELPDAVVSGALLEAIRDREAWAFECVWSMAATARAAVLRIVRRPDVADDVIQDTIVRTMEHLPDWVQPSGLERWMQVVAMNLARDFHRQHARRPTTPLHEHSIVFAPDVGLQLDPAQSVFRDYEAEHVRRILKELPPRDAALLRARDMEGRSIADLAARYAAPLDEGGGRVR